MLGRIAVNRLVGPTVNAEIGLAVAVEIQRAQRNRARDRLFENAGIDRLARCTPPVAAARR